MTAYGKVLDAVKRQVHNLLSLDDYSDGILMADFVSDYTRHIGRPLSYHNLGFATLYEFISAIPDVARIKQSTSAPNSMVVAMAGTRKFPRNVNSAHQSLPRHELFNSNKQIQFDPDVESLQEDKYGRYSLCMPVECLSPNMTDDDIKDEFSPAGDVCDVHRSENFIFVRFLSKEDLQNCLQMFRPEYDLRVARKSNKNDASNESHQNQDQSERPPARKQNQAYRGPANHREGPAGDADRHRGGDRFSNHVTGDIGRHPGGDRSGSHSNGDVDRRRGGDRLNNHLLNSPGSRQSQASGSYHDFRDTEASGCSTELFVSNIESKEDFEQAIQTYRPKHMNVVVKDMKKYAFVSMWNHEDALAVVRDLDQKMQTSRRLSVKFDTKKQRTQSEHSSSLSDSCPDVGEMSHRGGNNSHGGARSKIKTPKENGRMDRPMPELECSVDYSNMPPLVPHTEIVDPDGVYDLDTSVFVTNFPPRTMESQLRAVFKGYRVLDICVLNNGISGGCTSAIVFMSTIYESIRAVRSEGRLVLGGCPLKIMPPLDNILLKRILVRMDTGLREWS